MAEKQKRVSSVKLDATLVRMHAAAMKVYAIKAFESKYDLHYGLEPFSQASNAPDNAWYGKKMAFKQAQNIALFLGLKHYSELALNNVPSQLRILMKMITHSPPVSG